MLFRGSESEMFQGITLPNHGEPLPILRVNANTTGQSVSALAGRMKPSSWLPLPRTSMIDARTTASLLRMDGYHVGCYTEMELTVDAFIA